MIRTIRALFLLFAILTLSRDVLAQTSPRVRLDDFVYAELDQIIGSGLVHTAMYGQRPYRRIEIARLISEARARTGKSSISVSAERTLKRLERRFAAELDTMHSTASGSKQFREVVRDASVELLVLDSPERAIESAPTGGIAADINPLLNNREGERFAAGVTNAPTAVATISDSWTFGQHISAQIEPRFAAGDGVSSFTEFTLQSGSVELSAFNFSLNAGRQQHVWGQGLEGGMLMSSSSRPLDHVER